MKVSIKFTVFFDGTFWVGVFERTMDDKFEVSKVVLGTEPKDYEVYDFILQNYYKLNYSKALTIEQTEDKPINPKRLQREIKKETASAGVGTKAQIAMKLQYEDNKVERRAFSKEQKDLEKDRRFQLRQQKKKEKHNGH